MGAFELVALLSGGGTPTSTARLALPRDKGLVPVPAQAPASGSQDEAAALRAASALCRERMFRSLTRPVKLRLMGSSSEESPSSTAKLSAEGVERCGSTRSCCVASASQVSSLPGLSWGRPSPILAIAGLLNNTKKNINTGSCSGRPLNIVLYSRKAISFGHPMLSCAAKVYK